MAHPRKAASAYVTLGISPHATLPEIRTRYLRLCQLYHPDAAASGADGEGRGDAEFRKARFQEISEAWRQLRDHRQEHDRLHRVVGFPSAPLDSTNGRPHLNVDHRAVWGSSNWWTEERAKRAWLAHERSLHLREAESKAAFWKHLTVVVTSAIIYVGLFGQAHS